LYTISVEEAFPRILKLELVKKQIKKESIINPKMYKLYFEFKVWFVSLLMLRLLMFSLVRLFQPVLGRLGCACRPRPGGFLNEER
jgi:hypothetical protein